MQAQPHANERRRPTRGILQEPNLSCRTAMKTPAVVLTGASIPSNNWEPNAGVILSCDNYHVPGQEAEQCEDNFKRAYAHLSETGPTEIRSKSSGAKTPDGRSISFRTDR
ncbi:uncharacterized protein [Aegilops tauschii subsp. strangulata]|nr:uncharacterized protein LOC109762354 [Aegilops tauschii subsp. strangulata]